MPLTPQERSTRASIAAHTQHAKGRTNTEPARRAFMARFEDQVDPEKKLPEGERDNVRGDVERVTGGRGNDSITGNDAANTFSGGDGDDTINGGGGADVIEGGRGNDTLHGNAGNDNIFGGIGNDNLFGDEDNDFLHARDGLADVVDGGAGNEDRAERDEALDTVSNVEIIVV